MPRTLQNILWLTSATLGFGIVVAMFWQRSRRDYPVFWSYLLAEVLRTVLLFTIGNNNAHYFEYFYSYWITEFLLCLLGFFVVAELFDKAFSKRLGLRQWGRSLFWMTLVFLLLIAVLTAQSANGSDSNKLVAGILLLKKAESLVRLGLIAGLLVFVFVLGLPWSSHTIGIAIGLSVYGSLEFAAMTLRWHYGRSVNHIATSSLMGAWLLENFIWAGYFFPRRPLKPSRSSAESPLHQSDAGCSELEKARQAVQIFLER
jgi:hypothetical protein